MNALNRAQIDKYNSEYKLFEKTQEITDAFNVFKKSKDITFDDSKWELPDDYFHATNISSLIPNTDDPPITIEYMGKLYTDGEWLNAKQSTLLPPDPTHIKARLISGELEIAPESGVTTIRLYYLKSFTHAVFAYDKEDKKIVFKTQGSFDPDWPELEHNDLIWRTLKYLGVPLHDDIFIQTEQIFQQPATI